MIYDVVDERKMDHYMAFEVEIEFEVEVEVEFEVEVEVEFEVEVLVPL